MTEEYTSVKAAFGEDVVDLIRRIQKDALDKQKILLTIYSGMFALSVTALITLVSTDLPKFLEVIGSILFVTSAVAFLCISSMIINLLHRNTDLMPQDIEIINKTICFPRRIGLTCLFAGCLLLLASISIITAIFGVLALYAGVKYGSEAVKKVQENLSLDMVLDHHLYTKMEEAAKEISRKMKVEIKDNDSANV
jgi:hypothetical protein